MSERIERRISLHDLRILLTVVMTGSMGRAARQLATSQPAVSRSVSDLEHALGVRLLDRGRHGVEPTAFGRALVARGRAIFDELAQGIGEIRFIADPTAGQLRVGTSLAVATGFVAGLIDQLLRQYPRLAFDVLETDTASAFQALHRREVDMLIVHLAAPITDESLEAETLLDDPHVVVAAKDSPWARRRRLSLAELIDEPWVLPRSDAPYGMVVSGAFRASGLSPPRTVVTSTLPVRSQLLATGRYLSMIPRVTLQSPALKPWLRTLPIALPATVRPLAMVTLRNRTLAPAAQVFADHARATARRIAGTSAPVGARGSALTRSGSAARSTA